MLLNNVFVVHVVAVAIVRVVKDKTVVSSFIKFYQVLSLLLGKEEHDKITIKLENIAIKPDKTMIKLFLSIKTLIKPSLEIKQ